MAQSSLLIEKSSLNRESLKDKKVLITGAGGGIGFEAVRALLWMGADVVVAEVDKQKCKAAQECIDAEFGKDRARFLPIDIGSEKDIGRLESFIRKNFGALDVIFNNATVISLGNVHTVGIASWDKSYAVNLRSCVLLLERFLPDMLKRNSGVVVFVPSSGAAPFMGAYEVFKTAQVELCNTLTAELEGTEVIAFSIGPGLVGTDTAVKSIEVIAEKMGMTSEAFFEMNRRHILDAHTAGTGFAAAVALAAKYNGQEISSLQALIDAGIVREPEESPAKELNAVPERSAGLFNMLEKICGTYEEQYAGWQARNVFERQWIARDFKKETAMSTDQMRSVLSGLRESCGNGNWTEVAMQAKHLDKLKNYYVHQIKMLADYEKDPKKKEEHIAIINGWICDLQSFLDAF